MPVETLNDLFLKSIAYNKKEHILYPKDGAYHPLSSQEIYQITASIHHALIKRGIKPQDRIAILSENCPQWAMTDFAILSLQAITVPIYANLLPHNIAYILNKGEVKAIFVSNLEQLKKIMAIREKVPGLESVFIFQGTSQFAESWDALYKEGLTLHQNDPEAFKLRAKQSKKEDVATIIFTSGTTGDPKGVILTHQNLVSNIRNTLKTVSMDDEEVAMVFLPLAHVFERMVDYVYFHQGTTIAYAESLEKLPENLLQVRPTVFVSVPRLYEKIYDRIQETARQGSKLKQGLFHLAEKVARKAHGYFIQQKSLPFPLSFFYQIFDPLVYRKVRERLGGRLIRCLSGGAALNKSVAEFLIGCKVFILEGYGLTETSPVLTVNSFTHWKLGSVGKPIPSVEIKIAEDGEILAKGPNVFSQYYKDPEATEKAFTPDGYFKTGDVGYLDEEGFLFITDRKKDIIVTAGGKNIAPLPIEERFKRSIFVAQAVVLGNEKPYPIILMVPDKDSLTHWAYEQGIIWETYDQLLAHPRVLKLYEDILEDLGKDLPRFERPKRFLLIKEEFTVENGLLTPTMKVKRRKVTEKYHEEIENLYKKKKEET